MLVRILADLSKHASSHNSLQRGLMKYQGSEGRAYNPAVDAQSGAVGRGT